MNSTKYKTVTRGLRLGVLAGGFCLALTVPTLAASVLAGFEGFWRGQGRVSLTDGSREAIRCRASYAVRSNGDALGVDVGGASDSYRVHILAIAVAQGDSCSGSWQETTRQLGGTVTGGEATRGELQAAFGTMGGGSQLSTRVTKHRQAVTTSSHGSDIGAISISFTR